MFPLRPRLAASVLVRERSLFMVKVMYYVQVRAKTSQLQRDLVIKIPFLMGSNLDEKET